MRAYTLVSLMSLSVLPLPALADLTGAGDAAIVKQLVEQAKIMREQLQNTRDTLDVSRRLEEMESMKAVKSVHEEGRALTNLISETEGLQREYKDFVDDPSSFNRTEGEISWLGEALRDAKDERNAARAYASIMTDVKRLNFLGKANRESEKKLISGTNQEDDGKITASNTFIMSQILIENEEREQKARANNVNVMESVLGNTGYSALGEEAK
jgi:hypothetical protein